MKIAGGVASLIVMIGSLALVLITLSGQTRTWGLWIAGISIVAQIGTIIASADDDDEKVG
jgi:hypothetical protein